MLKVSFEFNPETKQISNVLVEETGQQSPVSKTTKRVAKKSIDKTVVLKGSSLQLNQEVMDLLNVKVGDRVCVRFDPKPVLIRPDIAGETGGGNLITKSLTVSCRGKVSETLAKIADEFTYTQVSEGYVSLNTSNNVLIEEPTIDETDKPSVEEINLDEDIDLMSSNLDMSLEEIEFNID